MENLLEERPAERRGSFELYKSHVCHLVKEKGDVDFLIETLESDEIHRLYQKRWYPEALYLWLWRITFPASMMYPFVKSTMICVIAG